MAIARGAFNAGFGGMGRTHDICDESSFKITPEQIEVVSRVALRHYCMAVWNYFKEGIDL